MFKRALCLTLFVQFVMTIKNVHSLEPLALSTKKTRDLDETPLRHSAVVPALATVCFVVFSRDCTSGILYGGF